MDNTQSNLNDKAAKALEKILETHFCDLEDTENHESQLQTAADSFFKNYEILKNTKIHNALSDESRIKILLLLKFREMCNCELTAALNLTQPNLTYHVKKLENASLVKHRREGKYTYYALVDEVISRMLQF